MKDLAMDNRFYVDVRSYTKTDELSYDISQHLPRRLSVGPVVVIADNPAVFLSVMRKRLAKLLYELERQRASTLDRNKRGGLDRELLRLRAARFTAKSSARVANPDVLCVAPYDLGVRLAECTTLYVTATLSFPQLQACLTMLRPGGLLVVYGDWPAAYDEVLS